MFDHDVNINQALELIFRYWGKARSSSEEGDPFHLLPYHCLDVTAVAAYWWDHNPVIRKRFMTDETQSEQQVRAWVLFFIALHDLGKFDIRFQCKADGVWLQLNPKDGAEVRPPYAACKGFDHGGAGLYWFVEDLQPTSSMDMGSLAFLLEAVPEHPYQSWFPWVEAVTGHHGYIVKRDSTAYPDLSLFEYPRLGERDKLARQAWLVVLEALFLLPADLSLKHTPPVASSLMAGFCSISDWLGSWLSEDTFLYRAFPCSSTEQLFGYFLEKYETDAAVAIQRSGLLAHSKHYAGVTALLKQGYQPRQLQTLVDDLPISSGLTLIEAPTGSGKTETALAYAWRLLDAGLADSIVFALPTQATANAMLSRLNKLADQLFEQPNVILAHGNSRFNKEFVAIKQRGRNAQQHEEAWAQCCEWLAQSRKRVFLGQVGVCTIDQVLVSVLPVRHRFIRGFGVGRSILLIDEVHAYSTYMYGLLEEVLKQQANAGGSAILLSATLPQRQKHKLLATYGKIDKEVAEDYPLVSWSGGASSDFWSLKATPERMPRPFSLRLEADYSDDLLPNAELLARMVRAAEDGAQVCLICNLVDVAQHVFEQLTQNSNVEVILFHSRYTLLDRQGIEERVLSYFGPEGDRTVGRILVATQVVEQSLDLVFDWLITQLCPVDLLFQRLGRLHRHHRDNRPALFREPMATVLLPKDDSYGGSGVIYSNTLVMWRTQQKIEVLAKSPLNFPDAYREWIEPVYKEGVLGDEPDWVIQGKEKFDDMEGIKRGLADLMLKAAKETSPFRDVESNVRAVTRDGEMSIPVIPYIDTTQGKQLLNGCLLESIAEFDQQEAQVLNRVNVPNTWEKLFLQEPDEQGVRWLSGILIDGGYKFKGKGVDFVYQKELGMRKVVHS